MHQSQKKSVWKICSIIVLLLLLNLPIISALEISNVRATDITSNSAVIRWDTDQPADSIVKYGQAIATLQTMGDANPTATHQVTLQSLQPEQQYLYSVESGSTTDNNGGQFYSFATPAPDTTPPELAVEIPAIVKGNRLALTGSAESGADISLLINGALADATRARSEDSGAATSTTTGTFTFEDIAVEANTQSSITIEAKDTAGNTATIEGTIIADAAAPIVTVTEPPLFIDISNFRVIANISEPATYEISVSNNSAATGEGQFINQEITLTEGKNIIQIKATDAAGWETIEEVEIEVDTQPPSVSAELERGTEYYQGRATSTINGKTEPGATVYLYMYRPSGYEYKPDFERALKSTTADENGDFTFADANLEEEPLSLEPLKPKEVPQGLQEITIYPIRDVAEQQQQTRHIYLIAEDKSGKTGFWQSTITLNTCFSANLDFVVQSLAQFQSPLRLNPELMDNGRESVATVFNMSYRGSAAAVTDPATGVVIEPAFEIVNEPLIERACTQGMLEDDRYALGCNLLPRSRPNMLPNADKTAWYVTWNLNSAEDLSKKDEDFWNEFKKRQIVFPLQIKITYRERLTQAEAAREAQERYAGYADQGYIPGYSASLPGSERATGTPDFAYNRQYPVWSQPKTQTFCTDVSYLIDIPVDSKDMLPDWLADEGLEGIEATIEKIDNVLPYLEKAIIISGVGCISSFLGRMSVRWARIVTSKLEIWFTRAQSDDKKCPANQNIFYLEDTIKHWQKLPLEGESVPRGENWQNNNLDQRCPKTASIWKFEALLDKGYKWSCDRVFCRAVPARWTADKDKAQVDSVIEAQQQCAATAQGVPLQEIENCQELIRKETTTMSSFAAEKIKEGGFTCYRYNDRLYVISSKQDIDKFGTVRLTLVHDYGLTIQQAQQQIGGTDLLAYRPSGSERFLIAQDQGCENACHNPRKPGYAPDTTGGITSYHSKADGSVESGSFGCYKEVRDETGKIKLTGSAGEMRGTTRFSAGYTKDCFINVDSGNNPITPAVTGAGLTGEGIGDTGLLQCVCQYQEKQQQIIGPRTAMKETKTPAGTVSEEWIYREDQIYKETGGRFGTYYPEWRYYEGRDFSSAFGTNYLLDYLPGGNMQVAKIDPFSQHIGAFQTACFSGIRARLILLRSVLEGVAGCIKEAKITGLRDAGTCKAIFAQHVCGLAYKAISYFFNQCSPYNFADTAKGGAFEDIGAVVRAGFESIPEAMQSSIDDLKRDYGNAKLNEFFATGAEGLAQSMCLAAFGYDWPLGMDFILDSAYAIPMKTVVNALPADRELATYNPARGTATYNYETGVQILPGCRIQSYDVYLKCIGPEDANGRPGIDCGAQGCDCLRATQDSAFEGQKIQYLEGGRGFDLRSGDAFDVPLTSPQKIDSPYRYDHVVVELRLDPYEDPSKCFDTGYQDGKFYFPIIDNSPRAAAVCQVQPATGKYVCPEIQSIFGAGGGSYLEDPYISCYDKKSGSWVRCDTPNLFLKGDEIKVKAHLQTDGAGQCLRFSVSGLGPEVQQFAPKKLPENLAGAYTPELSLGTVAPDLFSGVGGASAIVMSQESDPGCSAAIQYANTPLNVPTTSTTYRFGYSYKADNGNYRVIVPAGITVDAPFTIVAGNILQNAEGEQYLAEDQLRSVKFNIDGFKVYNLIGAPQGRNNQCVYQVAPGSSYNRALGTNQRSITVTAELLQPDLSGTCFNTNMLVPRSVYGVPKHSQSIVLQLEPVESQIINQMHNEFVRGNCAFVQSNAASIIARKTADLQEAQALYYASACYVLQGQINGENKWRDLHQEKVCNLGTLFFDRRYVDGSPAPRYSTEVENTAEFKKIREYMDLIRLQAKCGEPIGYTSGDGSGLSDGSATADGGSTPSGSVGTTCGHPDARFLIPTGDFSGWQPQDWTSYTCQPPTGRQLFGTNALWPERDNTNPQCWSVGGYTVDNYNSLGLQNGCPREMYCCPPIN